MAFSTTQIDVLEALVARMRAEGYTHYLCYQNLLTGVSNDYDMIVYFSKSEITGETGYKYFVPADSLCYRIRSGNASTYNNDVRMTVESQKLGKTVDISDALHISTNAVFLTTEIQPDYCLEVHQYETQGGILFTLSVFLLLFAFLKLFRR